jgi:hypothetical protein
MVNIGDVFILKYDEKDKKNRCVYYRKKYTITDLTKSKLTIFYKDNRTNYKCKCSKCSDTRVNKNISIKDIIIVETKLQASRNLVLQNLGIW